MINNIKEALQLIEGSYHKIVSQDKFKAVLKKYNNIELSLKTIHITGTNGKGSTSKMLSDIVMAANYKVGLFTSPHILKANERIRINNEYISDQDLIRILNFYYDDIVENKLNFFQIYFLVAIKYFYDNKVDLAIIEVGIGGRLDSTNVINSLISIITNINYDHTNKLGSTLEAIAYEKSGIIKPNSTTITGVSQDKLLKIINDKAKSENTKLIKVKFTKVNFENNKVYFKFNDHTYYLNSLAKYQGLNAQLVLATIKVLNDTYNYKIDSKAIIYAFDNFSWFGRFERISSHPEIIIDGAHNVSGIKALVNSANKNKEYVVIFSALKSKSYQEMLEVLQANFIEVVFCEFDFPQALKKADLIDDDLKKFSDYNQAINYVNNKYPHHSILICGSLYFIADVRNNLLGGIKWYK